MLDEDRRDYLQLLISGGGKGIDGRGADLREALQALGPTVRDTARVTRASARRKRNLRSLVHHYGRLTRELGPVRPRPRAAGAGSNAVFGAIAPEEQALSRSVAELPGTLRQRGDHAGGGGRAGPRLRPALQALRPSVRELGPTGQARAAAGARGHADPARPHPPARTRGPHASWRSWAWPRGASPAPPPT